MNRFDTWNMTDSEIQKEILQISVRLTCPELGFVEAYPRERDQIERRKAVLENVLAYRQRMVRR